MGSVEDGGLLVRLHVILTVALVAAAVVVAIGTGVAPFLIVPPILAAVLAAMFRSFAERQADALLYWITGVAFATSATFPFIAATSDITEMRFFSWVVSSPNVKLVPLYSLLTVAILFAGQSLAYLSQRRQTMEHLTDIFEEKLRTTQGWEEKSDEDRKHFASRWATATFNESDVDYFPEFFGNSIVPFMSKESARTRAAKALPTELSGFKGVDLLVPAESRRRLWRFYAVSSYLSIFIVIATAGIVSV